jgi:hypothetical protein
VITHFYREKEISLMRIKGVTYDTGFINAGVSTKENFEPDIIKREMQIIKNDLHCNAVRITGGDADRLEMTARLAADAGLEVWYCPFTCDLTIEELQNFLVDCAERAERIRSKGTAVVFLTGSEISLFTKGFFSDGELNERLPLLKEPGKLREKIPDVRIKMNAFLKEMVPLIRSKFRGKISYASIPFEAVDWQLFDIIATDGAYRNADNAAYFEKGIRSLVSQGKPVAITEFGCGTYRGAAGKAGNSSDIWMVDWVNGKPDKLNGSFIRDENEQAAYVSALLQTFDAEGVDAVFVTAFASYSFPHREDPVYDLDIASYGIVKVYENKFGETYPDMPWEPKAAFYVLAEYSPQRNIGT